MERSTWLAERRVAVEAAYDAEAATYEDYPHDAQRGWVERLLADCLPGGVVLDAPCGEGRYFPMVAAAGLDVVGIDQSTGMLREARRRGTASALHHIGLQELEFVEEFDAAMTIDAMENVPPEDWPSVLANLRRAVRPGGKLYFTVEENDSDAIARSFEKLTEQGLPVVRGEMVEGDVAEYHYYPSRQRVLRWLEAAEWEIIDEGYSPEDGWAYRHFLVSRRRDA